MDLTNRELRGCIGDQSLAAASTLMCFRVLPFLQDDPTQNARPETCEGLVSLNPSLVTLLLSMHSNPFCSLTADASPDEPSQLQYAATTIRLWHVKKCHTLPVMFDSGMLERPIAAQLHACKVMQGI